METGLIPDEEMVLNSLAHPERGDVKIIVAEYMGDEFVYVGNKRDPDNPFAVMHVSEVRNHTGRRLLDPDSAGLDGTAGEYSLYLITVQDRDILRHSEQTSFFSIDLQLNGPIEKSNAVKAKSFNDLDEWERWEYLLRSTESDPNRKSLEEEFYTYDIEYAKYRQSEKMETLHLPQRKAKERLGMLARDIYPNNIRLSLKRDFPAEHKEKKKYLLSVLQGFKEKLNQRKDPDAPESYTQYLNSVIREVQELIDLEMKTD